MLSLLVSFSTADALPPERIVICFGDSITFEGMFDDNRSYPQQIQETRPEWKVLNRGVPGDSTGIASDRLRYEVRRNSADSAGIPIYVPILLGINDPLPKYDGCDVTPQKTARRLIRMSRAVRREGATPILLTLTPNGNFGSHCPDLNWAAWTAKVNSYLNGRTDVYDLRPEFGGNWRALFPDGIHGTTEEARTIIADFVRGIIVRRSLSRAVAQPSVWRPWWQEFRPAMQVRSYMLPMLQESAPGRAREVS